VAQTAEVLGGVQKTQKHKENPVSGLPKSTSTI
jgi:hypothetical protein